MKEGIIIKGISGFYYVKENENIYECKARGILRKKKITPLVGDKVVFEVLDESEKKGIIDEIKPRISELIRPPIANIEKVMITFSIKEPNANLSLVDRFIVFAEKENLNVVLVMTKVDLADEEYVNEIKSEYENIGYKVIPVSSETGENIDMVVEELKNSTSVFAGQSGVGKSSILNAIDPDFNLKTAEISQKLGRGKHTTRHAELFEVSKNAIVADTPGFSSFDVSGIEIEELKEYFIEFNNYDECRFGKKCIHRNEPECAVKQAVEDNHISKRRYDSYINIMNEINNSNSKFRRNI
ncbi:ribosome small subunit-dependent GTPase A [Peptostreptococcus faecalis]|uniref:ribosome small subunit-dependent GTPase A n=1 Tax=Peptostreptococcus faecalis TaxID=2045015 RepID=UPI000C7B0C19|nr:ribosome small subunit-dependent GTPase A [Peptostreptococcus faecalis]